MRTTVLRSRKRTERGRKHTAASPLFLGPAGLRTGPDWRVLSLYAFLGFPSSKMSVRQRHNQIIISNLYGLLATRFVLPHARQSTHRMPFGPRTHPI